MYYFTNYDHKFLFKIPHTKKHVPWSTIAAIRKAIMN